MPPDESWEILEMAMPTARSVMVCRANSGVADSEGPTLHSREEAERFIGELREAADRVWPEP